MSAGETDALAQSFGSTAAAYDRVRPDVPPAAVERVANALGLPTDASVADVGAGTGKLTRLLVERFADVVAVEPDARMLAVLAAALPTVVAHAGTAEQLPLADASVDAIFVADAFHWFDGARAVAEAARVVRPGGGLVLLWNHWWTVEPPIPAAAEQLLREPFVASGRAVAAASGDDWRALFPSTSFGPLESARFEFELALAADDLAALYVTTSSLAALREEERERVRSALLELLREKYALPVTTEVFWSRRRERASAT